MRNDIAPIHDLIEHEHGEGDACVCGPDWRFCRGGVVVVHHPLNDKLGDGTYQAQAELAAAKARQRIESSAGE